jgi:hypothetical protein
MTPHIRQAYLDMLRDQYTLKLNNNGLVLGDEQDSSVVGYDGREVISKIDEIYLKYWTGAK